MLKKLAILMSFIVLIGTFTKAQNSQGTIKGKMIDKATKEPLAFANIVVFKGGSQISGTQTDFDGKYTITALTPGNYEIQATYVGYQPIKINDVVVSSGKITFVDLKAGQGVDIEAFEVIDYKVPLISKDKTISGGTVTREEIAKLPGRSAASIAATVGGVFSQDNGGSALNVRGTRANGTDTYIDGIKVRGTQSLPNSAIEQVSVLIGGIPAQFGDVTGGIVNITTRGPSEKWFGGIEYLTSGFKTGDNSIVGLDDHGFNLLGFSVSGPLLFKKDSAGVKDKSKALAGFFLSGELRHSADVLPSGAKNFKVKDDVLQQLNTNPISLIEGQSAGVINNANFIRATDLEEIPFRLNASGQSINLQGKIDVASSATTNLTFGGTFVYSDGDVFSRANSLLNSQNNAQTISSTYRAYARFTQRFDNSVGEESASLIKNAFVTFQADYSNVYSKTQNRIHEDRLSHYGYVGKFTSTRTDIFSPFIDTAVVVDANGDPTGQILEGRFSSPTVVLYEYEPGDLNPILSNYTSNYYDFFEGNPTGNFERIEQVQGNGGLVNGDSPDGIYGIYAAQGAQSNNYSFSNASQFRITASGSAEIKGHSIQIGFEFEQREDRSYAVSPIGLWRVGRGLVNTQIQQRSFEEGTFTILQGQGGNSVDNILLSQAYNAEVQTQFDKNLRAALGLSETGTEFIDFDSYGPDVWNIDFFTADELLTNGGFVGNFGYDHTGKKISGNPSLDDFFNEVDENGNFTRKTPSFRPIYAAGYIQDKFAFDDLIFNVGVRIDRYDANQSVLKDRYSIFPVLTAGEVGGDHPVNIGDDFVVYVQDASDPRLDQIVGYRNGNVWFNADGEEIDNPAILNASGIPNPWLVDPNDDDVFTNLDASSFKDFEPQINVSPRISFSFPISDEALFFAHYDILTQRPSSNNRLDLISYLNFGTGGGVLNNPELRAEQTIDYELGFQQRLSNSSALTISAFYKEQRNQIQLVEVVGAFPGNYTTFDNLDFGTVKGLTIKYDLRRTQNLTLNAYYTLQFADGTGSSATTSANLVASGNGNLRTLAPLNFDQRHAITLTADYRYGSGKNYNGPVIFGRDILQNMGANLVIRSGSGLPYTRTAFPVATQSNTAGTSPQLGQLNTSRLPFSTTLDLKVDKTVNLVWGKGEDTNKKRAFLNIYVQALNLLDAQNILGVYSATGNPDDDGFLLANQSQSQIRSQADEQSFRDLYQTSLATNQGVYSLPRRVRLGVQLNF